jgi:hypothetical protein
MLPDVSRTWRYARWPKREIIFDSGCTSWVVTVASLLGVGCAAALREICRLLVSGGLSDGDSERCLGLESVTSGIRIGSLNNLKRR